MNLKHRLKLIFLVCLSASLSACVQSSPTAPTISPKQLKAALDSNQSNIEKMLSEQNKQTTSAIQQQAHLLTSLQNNQQEILSQLNDLQDKVTKQQAVLLRKPKPKAETPTSSEATIGNKMLVGAVEALWIEAANQVFDARVDTGATTSSISARNVVILEKDGKRWARFELLPSEDTAQSYEVEAPVVRYVKIRQSSADGLDRRPVVKLKVRLGKLTEDTQFTLADRSEMNYPILLGREFLRDIAVVDVSKKYLQPKPEVIKNPVPAKATESKPAPETAESTKQ